MQDIVETLARQHRAIEAQMVAFNGLLTRGQLLALGEATAHLQRMLDAHFKLEERELYPAFLRLLGSKPELHRTITLFRQNSVRIIEGTMEFFARWNHQLHLEELGALSRDWEQTVLILQRRIAEEEKVLHPLYSKAVKQAKTGRSIEPPSR